MCLGRYKKPGFYNNQVSKIGSSGPGVHIFCFCMRFKLLFVSFLPFQVCYSPYLVPFRVIDYDGHGWMIFRPKLQAILYMHSFHNAKSPLCI